MEPSFHTASTFESPASAHRSFTSSTILGSLSTAYTFPVGPASSAAASVRYPGPQP